MRISQSLISLGALLLLIGCSTLPASGPGVEALFSEKPEEALNGPTIPVELIELTPTTALAMELPPVAVVAPQPAPRGVTSGLFTLQVGDQVAILIQEATTSLDSEEATPTPLPPQVIDASGQIMAPFAGPVKISGLTPVNAAKRIQTQLEGQLVEPQVVVSLLAPVGRTVSVIGDAIRVGGLFPIRTGNETILDAIASTGGFALPFHAMQVRLTRDNVSTVIPVNALVLDPLLNMRLAPGDVLSVEVASRHFTILGAVGVPGRFDFASQEITLIEALAQARGLNDLAAAAQGVAVLRQRDGLMPLLYRLDLRSRDGLLAAQLAQVADGDLIYVAPAPISDVEKVLRVLGLGTGPVLSTATLAGLGGN